MESFKNDIAFSEGLKVLGLDNDDALYFVKSTQREKEPELIFHIQRAKEFSASAVYLRKQINGSYKPQLYIFDFTGELLGDQDESSITTIHRKIWSSGEAPIACFFFKTNIKIIDCTQRASNDYRPVYLIENLALAGRAHDLYNKNFAFKIKSGVFWEEETLKNKFNFKNSAYDLLISNVRIVVAELQNKFIKTSIDLINKIIIQSILVKYLEERIDTDGNKLLSKKYFQKYEGASTFYDVLLKGKFSDLLSDLNRDFNGNVFNWNEDEQLKIKDLDLSIVAELLATDKSSLSDIQIPLNFLDWRYFEFKFIPVELISRLYEEFLSTDKKQKGLYYTPSHLAKLLVDECLPLKKFCEIDLKNFRILDPACGSGIFLVIIFKRLVQIWKLQNPGLQPDEGDLKTLLKNIYGVDLEEQAVRLASFSLCLALCNELNPIKIINDLKFDDLREANLVQSDFFKLHKLTNIKFDLIIGNPPYVRGGTKDLENKNTSINGIPLKVPNNQLALKFLGDSHKYLKDGGLQCLLVKSSGLLYNSSSRNFIRTFFSQTNVIQILDFTALARNRSLWDNKVGVNETPLEVDTAAVFARKQQPDKNKNILHVVFKRTKATRERIIFELDDYDLHYIPREEAVDNSNIWKINLLGGGRIRQTISKLENITKLKDDTNLTFGEGAGGAKSLPNDAFLQNVIDESFISTVYDESFTGKKDKSIYNPPNILIKENIDLPFAYNLKKIKFSNEIVGVFAQEISHLQNIAAYIRKNHEVLKFFNICTSGKMLVYKNTACKKEDILNLPIDISIDLSEYLSPIDFKIISEVNDYAQFFIRNGENSKAVQKITASNFTNVFENYGREFSTTLNAIYGSSDKKFRLSDVIEYHNVSFVAAVFKYDKLNEAVNYTKETGDIINASLITLEISESLSANRIIRMYPQEDVVVFIKPNQTRFWQSIAAYRDSDRCFADFSQILS